MNSGVGGHRSYPRTSPQDPRLSIWLPLYFIFVPLINTPNEATGKTSRAATWWVFYGGGSDQRSQPTGNLPPLGPQPTVLLQCYNNNHCCYNDAALSRVHVGLPGVSAHWLISTFTWPWLSLPRPAACLSLHQQHSAGRAVPGGAS